MIDSLQVRWQQIIFCYSFLIIIKSVKVHRTDTICVLIETVLLGFVLLMTCRRSFCGFAPGLRLRLDNAERRHLCKLLLCTMKLCLFKSRLSCFDYYVTICLHILFEMFLHFTILSKVIKESSIIFKHAKVLANIYKYHQYYEQWIIVKLIKLWRF